MDLLKIENLTFTYPLCSAPTLDNASLNICEGEFAVLCGATGSGKSTLLRLIKKELAPLGTLDGNIFYKGTPLSDLPPKTAASKIGFVMQNPEQQIVTDKVWHELAFGLESMGLPQNEIAKRVAETASYFGIESWYNKNVSELSGGQKQLLNLASVMIMNPDLLILDEPTAQLDPIAAADFTATLKKLNTDFSLTVIIAEHRPEDLIPICDKMIVLEKGTVIHAGAPRDITVSLKGNESIIATLPSSVRLYHKIKNSAPEKQYESCPLTIREGRQFITENLCNKVTKLPQKEYTHAKSKALEFQDVYFSYERTLPDVLCGTNITVYGNEIFCILGGNGSGKTTTLNAAAGLLKPYSGTIRVFDKKLKEYKNQSLYKECLSLLPQDVGTVFLKNTVKEELAGIDTDNLPFDLSPCYDKHPYDLSGGEQQLVALAKVLSTKPRLLLMDEPTKGLDANKKAQITEILKKLKKQGVTVVAVTHDVEFAASCADRCALFFRGQAVFTGTPSEFFSDNRFYTTAASRMSRGFFDNTVTVEQIAELALLNAKLNKDGDEPC